MLPAPIALPAKEEFEIYLHLGFRRASGEARDLIPAPALAADASGLMVLEPATSLGWRRRSRRAPQPSIEAR